MRIQPLGRNIRRSIRAAICGALVFVMCSCGKGDVIELSESIPETAEPSDSVVEIIEEPAVFVRNSGAYGMPSAKPDPSKQAEKKEEAPTPCYDFPDGAVIPMGSTAGISFGNGLKNYSCIDIYLGDISPYVSLRESEGLLYYGFTDSTGNYYEVSRKIAGNGRVVYLTFDDGPGPYTGGLLDTLNKYNAKATFFVVGNMGSLDILKRMEEEGHSIGAHTYSHDFRKCYSSVEAYYEDLQKIEDLISEQIGHETPLVRFPGGSSNSKSSNYCAGIMTKLTTDLQEKGYQYFDWNVTAADSGGTTETEDVIRLVKEGISSHSVSVVLQHDIKPYSVAGVAEILRWGNEKGYLFLPLTKDSTPAHFEHLHN